MFDDIYPDLPDILKYQGIVWEQLMIYDDWNNKIPKWDMFYYYINGPLMRFINNYYDYDTYNSKVFEKNMNKALHNYCHTHKEKAVEFARATVYIIQSTIGDYKPQTVISPNKFGYIELSYYWITTHDDACKYCKKYDNKKFNSFKMVHTHWNCRCKIKQVTQIIDTDGNIIEENEKIL